MASFYVSSNSKYVWKIENFSCLKGESFFSPPIEPDDVNWIIVISQENAHIWARFDKWAKYYVDFNCSFSLLDYNGKPLICKETIIKRSETFENIKDVFKFPNETKFYPDGILRVECRIWMKPDNYIPTSLFVRTQLEPIAKVIKKNFCCDILEIKESVFNFTETLCTGHNLGIKIGLPYAGQVYVHLETTLFGFSAKIQVSLLDATGEKSEFGNHNAIFESGNRSCQFKINVSRNMLRCHSNKFLVSGTLSLIFNCIFTGHFARDSIVEESEIFNTSSVTNSGVGEVSQAKSDFSETDTYSDDPQVSHTSGPDTVTQAFQKMLSEGYLSDFTLKVGDRTFPVHKSVLGVRSKVFSSMFASEMKEMQDNCVDIKDVDADTLQRMLQFVYSDRLDKNLDWSEASSLYAAADFYALEPLKQGCSTILQDGLCVTSALGVLALADLHQDQQLKSAALDFISLCDKDIIDTDAWIRFEEENAKLAMETLRKLYSKKMKG